MPELWRAIPCPLSSVSSQKDKTGKEIYKDISCEYQIDIRDLKVFKLRRIKSSDATVKGRYCVSDKDSLYFYCFIIYFYLLFYL